MMRDDHATLIHPAADGLCEARDLVLAFLSLFDRLDAFTFQTFADRDDDDRRRLTRVLHGSLQKHLHTLKDLNDKGAGIFFMVNRGNGQGRKKNDVVAVRAVFVDLDGAPLGPVTSCEAPPHAVVESSPGRWHAYWLVKDCALDQFSSVQRGLAARFSGDTKVCDLPRVMRLPGFAHQKLQPVVTRVASIQEGLAPYMVQTLVARLKLAPVPMAAVQAAAPAFTEEHPRDASVGFCLSSVSLLSLFCKAPRACTPIEPGTRHQALFQLARWLRSQFPEADVLEMRPHLKYWHETHKDAIGTKEFSVTWTDFRSAWPRVKIPFGVKMNKIIAAADSAALPKHIEALGYEGWTLKLVRLCAAAQAQEDEQAPGNPFFLSARVAGDLVGVSHTDASKALRCFVADGVLDLVKRGSGVKASRYRFNAVPVALGVKP